MEGSILIGCRRWRSASANRRILISLTGASRRQAGRAFTADGSNGRASPEGTYLVAWLAGRPVGHLLIIWTGCDVDEVRRETGGCPELNALGVWPPEQRRHGIGRDLLRHAEMLVAAHGSRTVGLGVAADNPEAARLYRRLGYVVRVQRYVDRWTWVDQDGVEREEAEQTSFLVKSLPAAQASGERAT
ncbi:hypothetical protein BMG523Draft_04039 [Frankia sp. BMG5.23]|nr:MULTISPECIES: GNAT family N-acetyltransferase [unclassified Frankia]KDA40543.1 hypothetical protein BMG523Draft_04651 [Frankia sp. BMG5.23]KDA41160.1 hypothetical protein BMG523Draft_04039 [Frankia sp. BMG5.23]